MQTTLTLRSEIEKGIAELGMNFSSFGELSGINRGIFSAILNGNPPKPISLNQMEAITRAFGQEPGWMFDLYIEECFYDGKPNRRRVEPFLIRCAELGRTDCIREVLSRLLEDLKHVSMIFEIAETLFTSGQVQESLVFYECVVENEKYNHAERLAVSHYRIFRAALGEDNEQNLRAAMRFEPFCGKLPDHHRLDALLQLTHLHHALERWELADHYSHELFSFSQTVYKIEVQRKQKESKYKPLNTDRPLVVYYGHGFLTLENLMVHYQNYSQAKIYNEGYKDLSWFEIKDDKAEAEISKLKVYAQANRFNIELLLGNSTILQDYMTFLELNPNELMPAWIPILQAANKHKFSVDQFFGQVSTLLNDQSKVQSHYNKTSTLNRYASLAYEAAIYHFDYDRHSDGIDCTLRSLDMAIIIRNKDMFMKCVPLFEMHRSQATADQKKVYEVLMKGVYQSA